MSPEISKKYLRIHFFFNYFFCGVFVVIISISRCADKCYRKSPGEREPPRRQTPQKRIKCGRVVRVFFIYSGCAGAAVCCFIYASNLFTLLRIAGRPRAAPRGRLGGGARGARACGASWILRRGCLLCTAKNSRVRRAETTRTARGDGARRGSARRQRAETRRGRRAERDGADGARRRRGRRAETRRRDGADGARRRRAE